MLSVRPCSSVRFRKTSWPIVLFVAALCLSATGCGSSGGPMATPEATLQTLKTAGINSDYATFVDCLSDDLLNEMAGQFRLAGEAVKMMGAMAGAMGPAMGGESAAKMNEVTSKLTELMKKHVPENAPPVNVLAMPGDSQSVRSMAREAGKAVNNREEFVVGFLKLGESGEQAKRAADANVTDLKIDGDTATATITGFLENGEASTIKLRRLNGQWKIDSLGEMPTTPGPGLNPGTPTLPM